MIFMFQPLLLRKIEHVFARKWRKEVNKEHDEL